MTTNNEAQQRKDMLMDLYNIHAYIPNDAVDNPLTPFGNFCRGYEAAKAESEKEVAELKSKVSYLESGMAEIYETQILELQAHVNRLREALERVIKADENVYNCEDDYQGDVIGKLTDIHFKAYNKARKALSFTPAQSLAEIKDGMINICIFKLRDMVIENVGRSDLTVEQCIKSLQELKGK